MTKEAYFEELTYALRRRELLPRPVEEDCLLPVEWSGRILCRVTERGAVRYDPTWVDTDRAKAALAQVTEAAGTVPVPHPGPDQRFTACTGTKPNTEGR